MKISVITRHGISNYGSLLQAFALQSCIEQLGHQAEIVDYIRKDENSKNITRTLLKKSKKWNASWLKRGCFYLMRFPFEYITSQKFRKYQKEYLKLSDTCYESLAELKKNKPIADIYCTGSDQVWGNIGLQEYDKAYFLDYAEAGKDKCISYAASFGKESLSETVQEAYQKLLQKYSHILVRENSCASLLGNWSSERFTQVLDPTLLLSRELWIQLLKLKEHKEKYVLIYQLHKNKQMDAYAKKMAKKMNMKLIRVSPSFHQFIRTGHFMLLPDIRKFLEMILNASLLITDSFHGTAFAINLNTQFIDILPSTTGTRIKSILNELDLGKRLLGSYDDFSLEQQKINFSLVNKKLESKREKSLALLKDSIEK